MKLQYQEHFHCHTQEFITEMKLQISGQSEKAEAAFCNSNMDQQL